MKRLKHFLVAPLERTLFHHPNLIILITFEICTYLIMINLFLSQKTRCGIISLFPVKAHLTFPLIGNNSLAYTHGI